IAWRCNADMTVAVVAPARPEDGRWTDFAERALRNIWPPALLSFDASCPNHLAPLLGKFDNEFAELGGRTCKWFCAHFDEPRFECGISKSSINLLIEDRDDLRRRVRGGCNAIPTARLVIRHKIADRRDVRQYVQACGGGNA